MSLRQLSTETVDQYVLKFQRLLRKVNGNNNNMISEILQVRMFLYELVPVLTSLVFTDNLQMLIAAIERAKTVETGYNYVPSKELTPFGNSNSASNQEIDDLTKKIKQLSLNYVTLTTALAAQPVR